MSLSVNSILKLVTALAGVTWPVQAAPKSTPSRTTRNIDTVAPPDLCSDNTTLQKLWSIKDLVVTYSPDLTKASGTGAFTLTNTRTDFSEKLKCDLRANYLCEFHGTPGDPGLNIWMQLNLDVAYITINQSWACGDSGATSTAFAVGVAEVIVTCPNHFYEQSLPCTGVDEEGFANGIVTVAQPPTPESPPSPAPASNKKHSRLLKRGAMPHVVESTTTTPRPIKDLKSSKTHPQGNLELKKKTWQALAMSLGRRRSGNSRAAKSKHYENEGQVWPGEAGRAEVPVGLYPLPKGEKETKKKKTVIKVDIEHLCSPSCRGGPKPPSWHLKERSGAGKVMDQERERRTRGGMTNPVRPVLLEVI